MEGKERDAAGRFQDRSKGHICWITIMVLLAWDGLLLYMILHCLIEPVFGAGFVALVSVYLGYQL